MRGALFKRPPRAQLNVVFRNYLNIASIWLYSVMLCDLIGSNNQKASSSFQKLLFCTGCLCQMMLVVQFKKRVKNICMYNVFCYIRNKINIYNIQLSNSFKSYHKLTSCDHNEEQSWSKLLILRKSSLIWLSRISDHWSFTKWEHS